MLKGEEINKQLNNIYSFTKSPNILSHDNRYIRSICGGQC